MGGAISPLPSPVELGLVERRVDLRDLLGLRGRLRLSVAARVAVAEVDAERGEVELPAVGADLLQRLEQRLALDRLARHLVRRADLDRPVPLETGGGRDQLADDDVLLETEQAVDLALDR